MPIVKQILLISLLSLGIGKIYSQKADSLWVHPNPFMDSANINFYISQDSKISIDVYNMIGAKVGTNIQDTLFPAGLNSLIFDATTLPNGVYIIKFIVGSATKKIIKVKKNGSASRIFKTAFNNDILVYPNPSKGIVSIYARYIFDKNTRVTIYDQFGKEVWTNDHIPKEKIELDLKELADGIYTLHIPDLNYYSKLAIAR